MRMYRACIMYTHVACVHILRDVYCLFISSTSIYLYKYVNIILYTPYYTLYIY